MAAWELALLLVGVTYLAVNTVSIIYVVYMMKTMKKFDGMIDKSVAYCEKIMDATMKELDED